uniref:Mitochondrial ribosomal protein S17 n=1 Tax=Sinocyclocheilus anshuiensis TaxID=1608454 RepID=A0A671PLL7_9TELE
HSLKPASAHSSWFVDRINLILYLYAFFFICIFLYKYYNKRKTYFAHDPLEQCTVGDVVLLKALPEKRSKHVNHELAEIVYKVGQVVDPLTGKRVAGTQYLEPLTESTEKTEVPGLTVSLGGACPSSVMVENPWSRPLNFIEIMVALA